MNKIYDFLAPVIILILFFVGAFGMFGLMAGRFDWFFGGIILLYCALSMSDQYQWKTRVENYPEDAITSEWDGDLACYVYSHEYYGRVQAKGDKKWAKKTAAHYNIQMPKNPKDDKHD